MIMTHTHVLWHLWLMSCDTSFNLQFRYGRGLPAYQFPPHIRHWGTVCYKLITYKLLYEQSTIATMVAISKSIRYF